MKNEHTTLTKSMEKSQEPAILWPAYSNGNDMNQWVEDVFPVNLRNQLQEQWLESLFPIRAMNKFQEYWSTWTEFPRFKNIFTPSVDVIERDEEVLVRAEIAGIKKEDIDLTVTDKNITIEASVERDEKKENGNYYRQETVSGNYTRSLSLPCQVVADKAKAKFKDGMLEITIPKQNVTKSQKVKVE